MEEAHRVKDIEAPPLSESMQHNIDRGKTKEASLPKILESMQRNTLWGNTNEANNFTIFRTPHNISQSKKNLFEPSVISIGPFHHGHKHLQALEDQKWRFLQDFLSRGNHISLDLCISEMMLLEEKTRRCYNETIYYDGNEFVEMMLLDGCFVLEYFLKLTDDNLKPTFQVAWNYDFIVLDLLLLENQIPFFVVEKLYETVLEQKLPMNFIKDIVCYFGVLANNSIDFKISDSIDSSDPPAKIHHLVHLLYHYLVPNQDKLVRRGTSPHLTSGSSSGSLPNSTGDISSMVIPCATELKHKGLKFKLKTNPNNMLDISFKHGVLEIPKLAISDDTKPIFANLIAFEHSKYGKRGSPFTCFVAFLDNLVNTPNDVTILQQCGIIENWLGSEEEVTHFINHVTEGNAFGSDHYLAELFKHVNKYSKKKWNRHRAKLISDYFSNPWAIISLVAAFILLFLTLVQSFFAVFAYFRPP